MTNPLRRFLAWFSQLFADKRPRAGRRRQHGCIWHLGPTPDGLADSPLGDGGFDVVRIAPPRR